jgi:hypothetical protein
MKHYDWETKIDPTHPETFWAPQLRDPRQYPFGVYLTFGSVVSCVSAFLWFEDALECLAWLKLAETKRHELDPDDQAAFLEPIEAALTALSAGHAELTQDVIDAVNDAGQNFLSIDWYGSLEALVAGASDFALRIRSAFWESELEDDDAQAEPGDPIPAERMDDFVEFLTEYGA